MADNNNGGSGSSNTGIVAILVIFLVVAPGVGIFAFRGRIFGNATKTVDKVDVNAPETAR
jgi:hypothetical protein